MTKTLGCIVAAVTVLVAATPAWGVLFDFDAAPVHTSLPLDLTVGGITGHFSATGQGFSIQQANTMGFTPAGFSGLCLYPSSVFAADLLVSFSARLSDFSIMFSPQELGCDDSATMRVTAYMNDTLVGTNTATAPAPGTWPTGILSFTSAQPFDRVVVHYAVRPPTCQDWGPIFMADNMNVTRSVVAVEDEIAAFPLAPHITPNPFALETAIRFGVMRRGPVLVTVHDVAGRLVRTLAAGADLESGRHELRWSGLDDRGNAVANGVYLCRIQTAAQASTTRLVLLRNR